MTTVYPFKVTPDDLQALDGKTRDGIQPLIDALNTTLQQVVQALQQQPTTATTTSTFVVEDTGTVYVDIAPKLQTQPYSVVVDQLVRSDGEAQTATWSWTWTNLANGVRLLFIGLEPATKYSLTVTVK